MRPLNDPQSDIVVDRAFDALAVGRVVWGVAAYVAPRQNARAAGLPGRAGGETVYLTRVFGSRALALGLGYLLSEPATRPRLQRLGLVVDAGDTAAGLVHLVRGDIPRRAAGPVTAITGAYAAVGVLGLVRSLRRAR